MAKRPNPRTARGIVNRASTSPQKKRPGRLSRAIQRVSWIYLVVIAITWALVRFAGDRWWPATLLLFGPTWVFVLPGVLLIPAAFIFRWWSLGILGIATALAMFELAGLCIPFRTWFQGPAAGQVVRVMTCNGNEQNLDESALEKLVADTKPDVILLQEWPGSRKRPPLLSENWHFQRDGELIVASRYPIVKSEDFGDENWADWGGSAIRYDIDTPGGMLHVFNLHLASPHLPFAAVIAGKPSGAARLKMHLAVRTEQSQKLSEIIANTGGGAIIAGDFNTLCQGSIYHGYWSPFSDAFSTAGLGVGHTYFAEGAAVRIDHIIMTSEWKCRRCWVGNTVGSPHRPVIADLERGR